MAKSISENRLAKKIKIKPARLRLWRNSFLRVAPKSEAGQRGASLQFGRKQVFTIMMAAEILRHGGSSVDASDKVQQIEIDSPFNYLYRRVYFVPGSDEMKMTSWLHTPEPPPMIADDDVSLMVINLNALRVKVDKILG